MTDFETLKLQSLIQKHLRYLLDAQIREAQTARTTVWIKCQI